MKSRENPKFILTHTKTSKFKPKQTGNIGSSPKLSFRAGLQNSWKMATSRDRNKTLIEQQNEDNSHPKQRQAAKHRRTESAERRINKKQMLDNEKEVATVPTSNSFELLDNNDMHMEITSEQGGSGRGLRPTLNVNEKVKPIIIENTTYETLKRTINDLKINCHFQKMRAPGSFKVLSKTTKEKDLLMEKLSSKNHSYHTYAEQNVREMEFVLINFEYYKPEKVQELLKAEGIQATRVNFLRNDTNNPIYKVAFAKGTTLNELTQQNQYVDNLKVKWEKLINREKFPTQCKNCQYWGHTKKYCHHPYRCVKCSEKHEPGQCKRKKTDMDNENLKPTCVNCHGEHLASSYQCAAFIKHQQNILKRRKPQRQPREFISTPAPWAHQTTSDKNGSSSQTRILKQQNFPPLPGTLNYNTRNENEQNRSHQNFSENSNTGNTFRKSVFDLGSEFNQIPGIQEANAILENLYEQLRQCPHPLAQAKLMLQFFQSENVY